ncbi:hypothetical protein [Mesoplasma seiffertii]|uniref:hypothetical protein n=1 Tax=Mesoplasma seiffertii TaxID=28224 RepID=UPI00047A799F|nr:hypothetical protein [Mesoplasma seiffertii]
MIAIIVLSVFGVLLIGIGATIYFKYNKTKNKKLNVRKPSLAFWFKDSIWLIFVAAGIILLGLCIAVNI